MNPASPNNSNAPQITGTAEAGSTVYFYTDSACSQPVQMGTAAAFASPGLTVTVADNSTTSFWSSATDAAGHTSPGRWVFWPEGLPDICAASEAPMEAKHQHPNGAPTSSAK